MSLLEFEIAAVVARMKAAAKEVLAAEESTERARGIYYLQQSADSNPALAPAIEEVAGMLANAHERLARMDADEDAESVQWMVQLSAAADLIGRANFIAYERFDEAQSRKVFERDEQRCLRTVRLRLCLRLSQITAEVTGRAAESLKVVMAVIIGATKPADAADFKAAAIAPSPAAQAPELEQLTQLHISAEQSPAEMFATAQTALALAATMLEKQAPPQPPVDERKPPIHWIRAALNQLQLRKIPGALQEQEQLVQASTNLSQAIPLLDTVRNDAWSNEPISWLMTFNIVIRQSVNARIQSDNFLQSLTSH